MTQRNEEEDDDWDRVDCVEYPDEGLGDFDVEQEIEREGCDREQGKSAEEPEQESFKLAEAGRKQVTPDVPWDGQKDETNDECDEFDWFNWHLFFKCLNSIILVKSFVFSGEISHLQYDAH